MMTTMAAPRSPAFGAGAKSLAARPAVVGGLFSQLHALRHPGLHLDGEAAPPAGAPASGHGRRRDEEPEAPSVAARPPGSCTFGSSDRHPAAISSPPVESQCRDPTLAREEKDSRLGYAPSIAVADDRRRAPPHRGAPAGKLPASSCAASGPAPAEIRT
jgi:hypothetical protein